jgi:ATP-dependent DNA ligase
MQATQVSTPFHRPGWVYEEKVDGYRVVANKTGESLRLISRNGAEYTRRFPELAQALAALPAEAFTLDGEVAVYDQALISRFEWLRGRPKDVLASAPVSWRSTCSSSKARTCGESPCGSAGSAWRS